MGAINRLSSGMEKCRHGAYKVLSHLIGHATIWAEGLILGTFSTHCINLIPIDLHFYLFFIERNNFKDHSCLIPKSSELTIYHGMTQKKSSSKERASAASGPVWFDRPLPDAISNNIFDEGATTSGLRSTQTSSTTARSMRWNQGEQQYPDG